MDISDTTFIIPVRIESADRYRNLRLSVGYLLRNTNSKIIVMESDEEQYVPKILENIVAQFPNRLLYVFDQTEEKLFHRTKILNHMLSLCETPIVVNYDCDVLLPTSSYFAAAEMCRKGYDLVYPFAFGDGVQLRVELKPRDLTDFENTQDLSILSGFDWRAEYGFCQFFKKESYINGFAENECFKSYGPEDVERYKRWVKLGYNVGRVNDRVYHLEHSRSENSNSSNPFMRENEALLDQILNIKTKEELSDYYSNQGYYKDFLGKLRK